VTVRWVSSSPVLWPACATAALGWRAIMFFSVSIFATYLHH
jgi:hypothetical protein